VRPPIEALYRKAHELHFRGGDHAAAIAAWDAYLAAEPTGRVVAEARYNRALLLIRVGRYAEARAALEPYARGEIAGGYRRAEAAQLVERLPGANPDPNPNPNGR
jgi:tetratricopeptide (TPR) repeat protein